MASKRGSKRAPVTKPAAERSTSLPPKVIPPKTVVELVLRAGMPMLYRKRVGEQFRIGYYSRQDGLDDIWLVNDEGRYIGTTDREMLLRYFKIVRLSRERDYFGVRRRRLGKRRRIG